MDDEKAWVMWDYKTAIKIAPDEIRGGFSAPAINAHFIEDTRTAD